MKVTRSSILPFSTQQLYRIVTDVSAYPEFLKWCKSSEVLFDSQTQTRAKLTISYAMLDIEFITENQNTPYERINMTLIEGPFKHFSGFWQFSALSEEASKISVEVDFDFNAGLPKTIMAKMYSQIISSQLEAFEKRAQALYS